MSGTRALRAWQQRALDLYAAAETRDFTVTATPGAGKTTFALTLAADLLRRRIVDRVIVVAPTDHLRTQWADNAAGVDLLLDPTLANNAALTADYHGYVATYAQVAANPIVHRRRVEARTTLVILDEIHHAGDGLSWGDAVLEAFGPARRRLTLTGTPFRTSTEEQIPFVRYDEDGDGALRSVADVTYSYRDALADGVVRPVLFAAYSGVASWRTSAGDVLSVDLSDPGTKDAEASAWKTVLDPKGAWLPHVVAAADERLTEIRAAGMPDAGALLLASDQDSARAYAAIVEQVTGIPPVIAVSDDPEASEKIEQFRVSADRWLIAVRLVSEGVDIPRLAVGVWATSYRTPLFFAQAVGRFVRARRRGESATIFLPAVRPLLALAAELEQDREHVIATKAAAEEGLDVLPVDRALPGMSDGIEMLGADAQFAHVLFSGRAITGDVELDDEAQDYLGLPGLLTPEQTAALLAVRDAELRAKTATLGTDIPVRQDPKMVAALRKEIHSLVARYAARSGEAHASVHAKVRRAVPGPATATAGVDVLAARRDWLLARVG